MPLYFKFKMRLKPFKNLLKRGYESGGFKGLPTKPAF
nr:MAG TPA: hypothetical protein [Caudoviricetes sp.]